MPGSSGAFHCNDSLEDGSRFELPEVHVSQLCWTPGIPACSWKGSRGQVSLEAGVLLHCGFPGDPSLKAPRMPPLARAEHSPGQTPQDVQTWDSCQMCVGRWCPGTPHLALSTSCDLRAGTKTQIPSQLHFYLKDMGKHPAQNLLSSAPLCLEAEGVFAE